MEARARVVVLLPLLLAAFVAAPSQAQKGVAMTPDRLDSLTQRRTLSLRARGMLLTQMLPGITQQMFYRLRLSPDATDVPVSVFCSDARLSQFEHALTALFGYRLVGRSQGEGMALVIAPDVGAVAAAAHRRLQGPAALQAGVARAMEWIKQPDALDEIARKRCPSAGALRDESVRRAFRLHAALTTAQRATVMAGHPVVLPITALPAATRRMLPAGKTAPKWLAFYLYQDPWNASSHPRLAVRAEPSGETWLTCPPLDLAPARFPAAPASDPGLRIKLKGAPDLEDLEPEEVGPAVLEWLADQGKVWIAAEGLPAQRAGAEALKPFAAGFNGLSLEEALDRAATYFGATWRLDGDWILLQRRTTESAS
jgi:hypothetical protein